MKTQHALASWAEHHRELNSEERRRCETILDASGYQFSRFAVDEGVRRFANPQTFSMFLVDQHWWFDHQRCELHAEDFCQACKPKLVTNYVVFSDGRSNRYHSDRDCSGLVHGQELVDCPAPIHTVTVREAKLRGKSACLVCLPPLEDFTEEFEGSLE